MNKKMKIPIIVIFLLTIIGCRSYESKPIDWAAEVRVQSVQKIVMTNLDEVAKIALVGNPGLNTLRLKRANSVRVACETGWWDDPELDFDALHFLKPGDHPFLAGGSLKFTLPLSGVPGCEKKAAGFYADADAAAVKAAELDVAADARIAAVKLAALRARVKILEDYERDMRVRTALSQAEKLFAAGEVTAGDLASARRRRHARVHRLRTIQGEACAQEAELLKALGFLPGVCIDLPLNDLHAVHGKINAQTDPLALVHHPKVQEACAKLAGGEAALEAEIRRQYPELSVGPAYEREEGIDRLGLVAGLTLPLWNRNRKGIAEAEGVRDEARAAAISAWRDLVRDAAAARAQLENLLKHPPPPASEREQYEKLADAGELGPIDYLAVREEICDLELEESEWRAEVCVAEEELGRVISE